MALGDSFTEGVGDPYSTSPNGLRGWADHVAVALAQNNPELRYANFAVRGRRMDEILAEQVHTAVMLEPDLVTVYAGMNDLLLVRNDIDAMMARYADGLKTLQQTGAHVLAFTAGDLGTVPLFRRLRGRAAVYNELLRGIADDLGLQLVDFWRFTEFRDPRLRRVTPGAEHRAKYPTLAQIVSPPRDGHEPRDADRRWNVGDRRRRRRGWCRRVRHGRPDGSDA